MGPSKTFESEKDIPSLAGKVIFITGGTAGLGQHTLITLAKKGPAHLYFTGRNASRAQLVIDEIHKISPHVGATFIECDFESISSIRAGMKGFTHTHLDVLICNAGIMAQPCKLSKDGYEVQFAINHLAHACVIQILLPVLLRAASKPDSDVRIVLLTSLGWKAHPRGGITFETLNTTQPGIMGQWVRYGQSKFANLIYAAELARRYPSITSVSIHPGVIYTGIVNGLGMGNRLFTYITTWRQATDVEHGTLNSLWAAVGAEKGEIENGAHYLPVGKNAQNTLDKDAKNEKLAGQLWEWTEKALGK